ncbi:uncharacterized protein THITE_2107909 [Thermothielavioides terrestris NRRL 8126]|uniref:Uncharacterized protein n=1 Tax=Thermothielavioides terrestris (strain ATCC 38088 / NRRL 8126) TaxID=578455 RepID=G2QW85_THETT|nr:uncharacterized protein THITE_2107909 [Thermothielavioides terrestris NRRL 8126]AEO63060.1 hypothetical protein THITE_2107909 [Thermothielavioides terrestris NRRL 8126]
MDDPWRSPWATTDSDKDQKHASPALPAIAAPPRAFLSASSSPRIPAALEQSPWGGDDDGFGDWATASETQAAWAGGWGASSPNLSPNIPGTPRDEALSKASPIAWPGNVATTRPPHAASLRQPSPDPWANGFASRPASIDRSTTPRLVVDGPSSVDAPADAVRNDALVIEEGQGWAEPNTNDAHKQIPVTETNPAASDAEVTAGATEQTVADPTPGNEERVSIESAARSRECRSSTPSNDNTDREDERQESPITSLDEEPSVQRNLSRKASGKVQELVLKFDGLARAASEEGAPPLSTARSRRPLDVTGRDGSDDAAEFGDFEDADENEPPIALETAKPESAEEDRGLINDGPPATPPATTLRPPTADASRGATSPIAKFGPLNFAPDLDLVQKLFPPSPSPPTRISQTDRELPDHIINDSFTEISERKTWYRISRLGSSRRHNAADDESYRRVAWQSSTVHDDVIKIVRRWMEEDSIAGRVALGGGISKTQKNMFGWDSAAEPVALEAVFGRKKSHARASSLQPIKTTGPASQGLAGMANRTPGPTHRPSGSAGPAVPSFGWSNGSPVSSRPPPTPSMLREPPNASAAACQASASTAPVRGVAEPGASLSQPIAVPADGGLQVNETAAADGGDDDEWGEMVSSPVAPPVAQSLASVPIQGASEHQSNVDVGGNQPAPHAQAPVSIPDSMRPPAKAVSKLGNPAVLATSTTRASDPAGTLTSDRPPTQPARLGAVDIPSGSPQHEDDYESAQRIIANLPDLSYMLR